MRSRIASVFTILALMGGTGGAIAVAAHSPSGGPNGSGAAKGQYCEGKQKQHGKDHAKNRHKGEDCGEGDDNGGVDQHGDGNGHSHGHHAKDVRKSHKH